MALNAVQTTVKIATNMLRQNTEANALKKAKFIKLNSFSDNGDAEIRIPFQGGSELRFQFGFYDEREKRFGKIGYTAFFRFSRDDYQVLGSGNFFFEWADQESWKAPFELLEKITPILANYDLY
jgi:hypothetical protein